MEKKTKLTISGTAKKSFKNIELAKSSRKKFCSNRKTTK
jgi:translation initiation factor IF-2